jgi:hypothetical protein
MTPYMFLCRIEAFNAFVEQGFLPKKKKVSALTHVQCVPVALHHGLGQGTYYIYI